MAAGDTVIKGVNGWTEQPKQKRLRNGVWKAVRIWHGPVATIDAQVDAIQETSKPDEISVRESTPAVIEAEYGSGTDQSSAAGTTGIDPVQAAEDNARWELIGQDLEKPLATHGYFHPSAGASAGTIEQVDEAIRKGIARETDWSTAFSDPIGTVMQSYCNHRLIGIDTWISFAYVVRKTITFSDDTLIKEEFSVANGSKKIPGKVIQWNDIGVPASAKFQQPKVHTFREGNAGWADVSVDEWLVKAPHLVWDKRAKMWELVREWWGAEKWSSVLYEGGSFVP